MVVRNTYYIKQFCECNKHIYEILLIIFSENFLIITLFTAICPPKSSTSEPSDSVLTDAALALIKRFIKLKPEHQDIVAKFISELATDFGNLAVPESSNEITVEEAEAAYIKSHSRNVRKTASPALNIIDGNTGKKVKLTSCFTEYNRTHEASP